MSCLFARLIGLNAIYQVAINQYIQIYSSKYHKKVRDGTSTVDNNRQTVEISQEELELQETKRYISAHIHYLEKFDTIFYRCVLLEKFLKDYHNIIDPISREYIRIQYQYIKNLFNKAHEKQDEIVIINGMAYVRENEDYIPKLLSQIPEQQLSQIPEQQLSQIPEQQLQYLEKLCKVACSVSDKILSSYPNFFDKLPDETIKYIKLKDFDFTDFTFVGINRFVKYEKKYVDEKLKIMIDIYDSLRDLRQNPRSSRKTTFQIQILENRKTEMKKELLQLYKLEWEDLHYELLIKHLTPEQVAREGKPGEGRTRGGGKIEGETYRRSIVGGMNFANNNLPDIHDIFDTLFLCNSFLKNLYAEYCYPDINVFISILIETSVWDHVWKFYLQLNNIFNRYDRDKLQDLYDILFLKELVFEQDAVSDNSRRDEKKREQVVSKWQMEVRHRTQKNTAPYNENKEPEERMMIRKKEEEEEREVKRCVINIIFYFAYFGLFTENIHQNDFCLNFVYMIDNNKRSYFVPINGIKIFPLNMETIEDVGKRISKSGYNESNVLEILLGTEFYFNFLPEGKITIVREQIYSLNTIYDRNTEQPLKSKIGQIIEEKQYLINRVGLLVLSPGTPATVVDMHGDVVDNEKRVGGKGVSKKVRKTRKARTNKKKIKDNAPPIRIKINKNRRTKNKRKLKSRTIRKYK